jgi:FkbM family methyltransferase
MAKLPENIVELTIAGVDTPIKMQLHGSDDQIISARLRSEGCWEEYETQLTLQHLHTGDVYVDVGANIGYYTVVAAKKVGAQGKVIAYEPDPINLALLKTNVAMNALPQVQIFPYALYDKNEEGKLYLSDDNFGDHRVYASPQQRESRAITLVHGGEHVGKQTQHIDFLKIDTQGAEFFVVNGLKELIHANRNHLRMILEFCPYGIRHSGADGKQLLDVLDDIGMKYYIIDQIEHRLIPAERHHIEDWVNELADEPLNEGFINMFITPMGYVVD